jgi:hypothetical protein
LCESTLLAVIAGKDHRRHFRHRDCRPINQFDSAAQPSTNAAGFSGRCDDPFLGPVNGSFPAAGVAGTCRVRRYGCCKAVIRWQGGPPRTD